MGIPYRPRTRDEIFGALEAMRQRDLDWRSGRVWAYVYDAGREAEEVCKDAYRLFMSENGLDPTAFPSLLHMENDVVGMIADHVHAPPEAAGTFTSGGTESIILAVKTARDAALSRRPDLDRPQILLPHTAHASFQKAAHYLGLEAILVPVDPVTFKADPAAMREAITDRTVMIVGSAVSYAHGVLDPIEELGRLALEHDLWFHVDGCIGGFVLPYFERLGAVAEPFDFRVPGVTSMSVDLHKYAFAAKGASVLLLRHRDLRRHQYYACAEWSGYALVNPTVQSTKSGGPLAGAWAVLNFIGDAGYLELCRRMLSATQALARGIEEIEGLHLMAWPDSNLIAFGAEDGLGIFHVADEMTQRGWHVQPQLCFGDSKESIHLIVNPKSDQMVSAFLEDLRAAVAVARTLPVGAMALMAERLMESLARGELTAEGFESLMAAAGVTGGELPERLAPINELLNALPPALREKILTEFMGRLFTCHRGEQVPA